MSTIKMKKRWGVERLDYRDVNNKRDKRGFGLKKSYSNCNALGVRTVFRFEGHCMPDIYGAK